MTKHEFWRSTLRKVLALHSFHIRAHAPRQRDGSESASPLGALLT